MPIDTPSTVRALKDQLYNIKTSKLIFSRLIKHGMHFQLKGHKALQQTVKTPSEGLCNQKTPTKKIYQIVISKSLKTLT